MVVTFCISVIFTVEFLAPVIKMAFFLIFIFFTSLNQEVALEEMKKELQARPTEKLVEDLHKKVKILQVVRSLLCY
jgi:TRAP-type uncharacterized transport system fused permease subunit